MKTNKKLSLENFKVKSFVTNLGSEKAETVVGGIIVIPFDTVAFHCFERYTFVDTYCGGCGILIDPNMG